MFLTQEKLQKQPLEYFPPDFDVSNWTQISAAFDAMLHKPITNPMELLDLLYQTDELTNLIYENFKLAYLKTMSDTNDEAAQTQTAFLLENVIMPTDKRVKDVLKLYYEHPFRLQLNQENYRRLNQLAAFQSSQSDCDGEDKTLQINTLIQNYHQAVNRISLQFGGNSYPIKAVSELLPNLDLAQKEELWQLRNTTLTEHKAELADIMDKLIQARQFEAVKSGHKNYFEYALSTGIFGDIDIQKLGSVHNAIRNEVLPVVRKIVKQRKQSLKLKSLRPWEWEADPQSAALHPFTTSDELVEKAISVLYDIRFEYGILLNKMHNSGFLDLDYRPEKVKGEYYSVFSSYGAGYVLMNCTGKHRDMIMLFHEMGHILQSAGFTKQVLGEFSVVPVQARELASQSMEYLTTVYWDTFYPDKKDRQAAMRSLFEQDLIQLLQWSMLNSFELVIYSHPDWSMEQREKAMYDLCRQYDAGIDWSGLEDWQSIYWLLETTLFDLPMYNFFSSLSTLGVWQVFRNYRHNPVETMSRFQAFIEKGSDLSMDEIMKELDIKQDFSENHIRKLIDFMMDECKKAGK